MSSVYIVVSGGSIEVYGNLKTAYDVAIGCFDKPVVSTVIGEAGPDCWIEYDAPTFSQCKDSIKKASYFEVEEKGDSDHTVEIQKQEVRR